jgi:hypothetical protein
MSARESAAVQAAVAETLAHPSHRIIVVAAAHGVARSSLKRALRRRGIGPRPPLSGPEAAGWVDGRTLTQTAP